MLTDAVGDLHGDWQKAIDAFRTAGVITVTEDEVIWSGGDTVVVQLGDVLDRGDYEIGRASCCPLQAGRPGCSGWQYVNVMLCGSLCITAIVNLIRGLDQQAREQGGAVYMLNGNHESLNICGDFR